MHLISLSCVIVYELQDECEVQTSTIACGVKRDNILSPNLFIVYIDELSTKLKKKQIQ